VQGDSGATGGQSPAGIAVRHRAKSHRVWRTPCFALPRLSLMLTPKSYQKMHLCIAMQCTRLYGSASEHACSVSKMPQAMAWLSTQAPMPHLAEADELHLIRRVRTELRRQLACCAVAAAAAVSALCPVLHSTPGGCIKHWERHDTCMHWRRIVKQTPPLTPCAWTRAYVTVTAAHHMTAVGRHGH
jgi:hypothetical protein